MADKNKIKRFKNCSCTPEHQENDFQKNQDKQNGLENLNPFESSPLLPFQ